MDISGIKLKESKEVVLSQSEASQLLSLYFAGEADELTESALVDRIEYLKGVEYNDLELYELDAHMIRTETLQFRVPSELYEKYKDMLNIASITEENIMLAEYILHPQTLPILGYINVPELFNEALKLSISETGLRICEYVPGMEDGVNIYDCIGDRIGSFTLDAMKTAAIPEGARVPYISTRYGKEDVAVGDIIGIAFNGKCLLRKANRK